MNRHDLESLECGDSVLGALGRLDEHMVLAVEPIAFSKVQETAYRDVRLTLDGGLSTLTRLWAGGPEVLVSRNG